MMNDARVFVGVLGIGGLLALAPIVWPGLAHSPALWHSLGAVYLLTGGLLGGSQFVRDVRTRAFEFAVATATVSMFVAIGIRVAGVLASRPGLTPVEVSFVVWQLYVVIPVVAAAMLPLGAAGTSRRRALVGSLVVGLFLVTTARGVLGGLGFGSTFFVIYQGLVFLAGTVAGVPLYLSGRSLRGGNRPTVERWTDASSEPN